MIWKACFFKVAFVEGMNMWVNGSQKSFKSTDSIRLLLLPWTPRAEEMIEVARSAKTTMIRSPKKIEPLAWAQGLNHLLDRLKIYERMLWCINLEAQGGENEVNATNC
jgi:hypothetical protein